MTIIDFEKVIEQRAIVDNGNPQFLGAGLAALAALHQRLCGPIVLDHVRMIDGDVIGSSLEVLDWITACGHHLRHQIVGLGHSSVGVIDKACLHPAPFLRECVSLLLSQGMQLEAIHASGALPQDGICFCRGANRSDSAFVFGTKALP